MRPCTGSRSFSWSSSCSSPPPSTPPTASSSAPRTSRRAASSPRCSPSSSKPAPDLQVERRLGLAGTQVCFEALRTGAIDVYPEYTGTGLVSILGRDRRGRSRRRRCAASAPSSSPAGTSGGSRRSASRTPGRSPCRRSWPSARSCGRSPTWRASPGRLRGGFGHEFVGREDGLLGLERTYGLRFASVQPLQQALQYQAAGDRRIDAIDVYTTDARLLRYRPRGAGGRQRLLPAL